LFVGDGQGIVRRLGRSLAVEDSVQVESPPADCVMLPGGELLGVMPPNDLAAGKVVRLPGGGKLSVADTRLSELTRPVQATTGDLDGRLDLVVCNHGNYTGNLSWYSDIKAGKPKGFILKAAPGARKAVVRDLNRDGKLDVVALFAQGNEGIWAFYNQGNGRFKEEPWLRFPPVYGSSYFQLVDFNKDGFEDILCTNGDNADYSATLKKYHGVRLFLNDGAYSFKEVQFFPLHGATQAEAHDFDGDGDLDIAAIAFFPDYNGAPEEGFVYLENTGNRQFTPRTLDNARKGKWLVMETGDFDGDGDVDIALGSFVFSPVSVPAPFRDAWQRGGASVLVLYNQQKSPT